MAQPTPPHIARRRQIWQRVKLYFLAGATAALFAGSCSAVAVRQAKARRVEVEKQATIRALDLARLEAEQEARWREQDAWVKLIPPFLRAKQRVEELEQTKPTDRKALSVAVAQRDAALAELMGSPKAK